MEFCKVCGGIMTPDPEDKNILKCNGCGNKKNLTEKIKNEKIEVTTYAKETVKELGEDLDLGPGINEVCPKCGHDKATYELKQTRSADEAPTRFFTCKKCKHKWREYS